MVKKLETVVVGGGIAGIMAAYFLSQSGHKVTVLEADKVLQGVTSHTTAKINALQGKYKDIPTKKKRRKYFHAQIEAVDGIEQLVQEHNIKCGFERKGCFLFADKRSKKNLEKEYTIMRKFAGGIEYHTDAELPFGKFDAVKLGDQAQFSAVEFCRGLIANSKFDIIENCRIKKVCLCRRVLKTEDKAFRYKRVVFATGFPIVNIRGIYAFKMYKSFSYAVRVPWDGELDAIYCSMATDGFNYRSWSNDVVISGLDHRTGRWRCDDYYAKLKSSPPLWRGGTAVGGDGVVEWSANDCMTFDNIPYAGRMFRWFHRRSAFVISGFGKWGMTNSYISARIVDDIISKRKNPYRRLYKPTRVLNIAVWPSFLWNFLQDGCGLVAGLFSSRRKRCPHMGCRMKFNPNTKTWDCPCHGSRFTEKGDIIVSPAVDANEVLMRK